MDKREKLSRLASLQKLKKQRNKETVSDEEVESGTEVAEGVEAAEGEGGNESSYDDAEEVLGMSDFKSSVVLLLFHIGRGG